LVPAGEAAVVAEVDEEGPREVGGQRVGEGGEGVAGGVAASSSVMEEGEELELDLADLELLEELDGEVGKQKAARRSEHKFHKKAARSKGTRGVERDGGGYDGAQMVTGKKGGLVRVGGY
jgi:large subunit GTPase 1